MAPNMELLLKFIISLCLALFSVNHQPYAQQHKHSRQLQQARFLNVHHPPIGHAAWHPRHVISKSTSSGKNQQNHRTSKHDIAEEYNELNTSKKQLATPVALLFLCLGLAFGLTFNLKSGLFFNGRPTPYRASDPLYIRLRTIRV
ncbi:hypothetical protein [Parapedobacter sp. DT-150]|uniref:hypothetical protein n=1 Tax=Parapedobacter sp. DT-150 TaxID=3396162 RepID=UPI003F1DFA28